jgi:hypothetical protein
VFFAEVQELTRDGRLVWRWNARGHIALEETERWWPGGIAIQQQVPKGKREYDPMHINSIAPVGGDVVISTRHTDAVYRIDRRTGRVEWKLGGTHTKRSLEILNDPQYGDAEFGGQHDARVLPDGTVTVYDNSSGRDRPPRLLRFRIDTGLRTATLIEEITDPDALSSSSQGSARRLPGGNWVASWASEPYVTETTPAGKRVLRLYFPDLVTYRALPILPGRIGASRLRAAMDAMHPREP